MGGIRKVFQPYTVVVWGPEDAINVAGKLPVPSSEYMASVKSVMLENASMIIPMMVAGTARLAFVATNWLVKRFPYPLGVNMFPISAMPAQSGVSVGERVMVIVGVEVDVTVGVNQVPVNVVVKVFVMVGVKVMGGVLVMVRVSVIVGVGVAVGKVPVMVRVGVSVRVDVVVGVLVTHV